MTQTCKTSPNKPKPFTKPQSTRPCNLKLQFSHAMPNTSNDTSSTTMSLSLGSSTAATTVTPVQQTTTLSFQKLHSCSSFTEFTTLNQTACRRSHNNHDDRQEYNCQQYFDTNHRNYKQLKLSSSSSTPFLSHSISPSNSPHFSPSISSSSYSSISSTTSSSSSSYEKYNDNDDNKYNDNEDDKFLSLSTITTSTAYLLPSNEINSSINCIDNIKSNNNRNRTSENILTKNYDYKIKLQSKPIDKDSNTKTLATTTTKTTSPHNNDKYNKNNSTNICTNNNLITSDQIPIDDEFCYNDLLEQRMKELKSKGKNNENIYDEVDLISECSTPTIYTPGKYLQLCDISPITGNALDLNDVTLWPTTSTSDSKPPMSKSSVPTQSLSEMFHDWEVLQKGEQYHSTEIHQTNRHSSILHSLKPLLSIRPSRYHTKRRVLCLSHRCFILVAVALLIAMTTLGCSN